MGRSVIAVAFVAACAVDAGGGDPQRRPPSTVFVSDRGANAILRYDGLTGQFEGVFAAGPEQRVDRPASVRLGPSGHMYMAGFGRGDVIRYDVASGEVKDVFYWDTNLLEEPVELAFRGDETLVLGNDTGNVVVLDRDGVARRDLGYPEMRGAHDLVLDRDQRTLYVAADADDQHGAIQVWDADSGAFVRRFGAFDEVASATAIAMRADGTLYACDWDRGQVLRFDPVTGSLLQVIVAAESGRLTVPVALDFGPDDQLYVLDEAGIHRLDPDSGVELGMLVEARDGHNLRPRSFTFVTETAIAQAIARTR